MSMLESQKGFLKGPKRMKFLSTIGYAYFGTNESSVFAYVITYYDYYMMLCELMQRIL
jgi:hypothetical protein